MNKKFFNSPRDMMIWLDKTNIKPVKVYEMYGKTVVTYQEDTSDVYKKFYYL